MHVYMYICICMHICIGTYALTHKSAHKQSYICTLVSEIYKNLIFLKHILLYKEI